MIGTIVWDFNGTVLDDAGASVAAVNRMLRRRGLPPITLEWYRKNLCMPLETFYAGIRIAGEPIEALSAEFQLHCAREERPVFPEVRAALARFHAAGLRQLLLSSLHQQTLEEAVKERGIAPYFEIIAGRGDHTLGDKREAAKAYLKKENIAPNSALFIGDLITDWELANYVGAHGALIPKGHQDQSVLLAAGARVIADASQIDMLMEEWK